jgi:hypothetical protein
MATQNQTNGFRGDRIFVFTDDYLQGEVRRTKGKTTVGGQQWTVFGIETAGLQRIILSNLLRLDIKPDEAYSLLLRPVLN